MNANMPNPVIAPSFLSHFVTCLMRGSPFFAISVGLTVLSPTVFVIVVGLHVAGVVEISFDLCDVNVLNAFVVTGCVAQNVVGLWALVVVGNAVVVESYPHINRISDFKEKNIS